MIAALRTSLCALLATGLLAHADLSVHKKRRVHWKHEHPWLYAWHHLAGYERAWARCISFHESGNRRRAMPSAHAYAPFDQSPRLKGPFHPAPHGTRVALETLPQTGDTDVRNTTQDHSNAADCGSSSVAGRGPDSVAEAPA